MPDCDYEGVKIIFPPLKPIKQDAAMPNKTPSPEAMAAKKINEQFCLREDWLPLKGTELDMLTALIHKFMQPKWIKCSKRMPTEEDGNSAGYVLMSDDYETEFKGWDWTWAVTADEAIYSGFTKWTTLPDHPEPEDTT